jgi:hypothetical protein
MDRSTADNGIASGGFGPAIQHMGHDISTKTSFLSDLS